MNIKHPNKPRKTVKVAEEITVIAHKPANAILIITEDNMIAIPQAMANELSEKLREMARAIEPPGDKNDTL